MLPTTFKHITTSERAEWSVQAGHMTDRALLIVSLAPRLRNTSATSAACAQYALERPIANASRHDMYPGCANAHLAIRGGAVLAFPTCC